MTPDNPLKAAYDHATRYISEVAQRQVGSRMPRADLLAALGGPLPIAGTDPVDVINHLATSADPGIIATIGPRYFGFVTGGAVPVTVAADWLVSSWDQNACLYVTSPAASVMEDIVSGWIVELLGLPATAGVGFVTGCHMANFTCLAAARHEVLRRAGWNVETQGLQRAPKVRVLVGGEVHVSAVGALRYLGFGSDELEFVPVDGQGRMRAEDLRAQLGDSASPIIVCAQAGNVSTGASDPIAEIVLMAHARGAWVHVDGAFGLWAAAVPELRPQVRGIEGADSWATDAHKWLNVPYDSGLAIVADTAPLRAAMSMKASYLQRGDDEERIGMDWAPESSRRARVVPLYALFRALGREGLAALVRRNCALARRIAQRLAAAPGVTILNDVVLNQVLVQFKDDATTKDVIARVQADGTCWAGGALWQGQQAMRIAVSNWSTTEDDIDRSADAMLACYTQATELKLATLDGEEPDPPAARRSYRSLTR
ncbi:MAG: aspartate aminotransferase family protein [Acidobacterium sp.]|nr:aspartate aminotransferase family protein [Acidobacteriota bacterium]PHY10663.1 MAG: aspartate aminotransferase family protein [Acidobacterium sp.]